MTEQEWITEAERHEMLAEIAFSHEDYVSEEYHRRSAQACRHNSCYGTVE